MKVLRFLILFVLLVVSVVAPRSIGPLGAAIIWALCLVSLARSHPHGMLSFAPIYLLMLGIFHLGFVVPVALGITRAERPDWLGSSQLPLAIGLFTTATLAFTLGARLRGPIEINDDPDVKIADGGRRELFLAGYLVAVAGAAMLWMGVRQLDVLSGGYGAYFEGMVTNDVRLVWFGLMLFPIGLLVAAVGATPRQMIVVSVTFVVVLGPLFLGGFRGPVIVQAASLLAVWAHKHRRTARRVAVATLAIAMLLAPAIRVARDLDAVDAPSASANDPVAVLLEAGGSLRPLVITAERVAPGLEDLWMGRSYLMAVSRIALNLTARRSENRSVTPGSWATMHADLWAYEHGYGVGFSGVAEPYLNFGVAGVVVIFLFLGMVLHAWDRWLGGNPYRGGIAAASFGFVLWTVRNEVIDVFRAAVLAGGTVALAWLIGAARRSSPRRLSRAEIVVSDIPA